MLSGELVAAGARTAHDAIRLVGVSKLYGGKAAVRDLSFTIAQGSVTGLLGGNGAGKTTTIGMIMGLILPTRGTVHVLGADMRTDRHTVLGRINFESPYVDLPHRLTIRQNLTVFAKLYGVRRARERIAVLAEDLALTDLLDRPSGQLSAGQKTRVALAKALINEPELLLLDEPTASLDPDTADWIRARLETYRSQRGATVLLASHNMAEVERLCDRVIFMNTGTVVADDTPRALLDRYGRQDLEDVFLDVVRGRGGAAQQREVAE
jgi:ABC-2 type transport system ATP-binding protein